MPKNAYAHVFEADAEKAEKLPFDPEMHFGFDEVQKRLRQISNGPKVYSCGNNVVRVRT